jgi:hypothetical protein
MDQWQKAAACQEVMPRFNDKTPAMPRALAVASTAYIFTDSALAAG